MEGWSEGRIQKAGGGEKRGREKEIEMRNEQDRCIKPIVMFDTITSISVSLHPNSSFLAWRILPVI